MWMSRSNLLIFSPKMKLNKRSLIFHVGNSIYRKCSCESYINHQSIKNLLRIDSSLISRTPINFLLQFFCFKITFYNRWRNLNLGKLPPICPVSGSSLSSALAAKETKLIDNYQFECQAFLGSDFHELLSFRFCTST